VFFVEDDRHVYLALLKKAALKYGFWVEGYCLMTNHIHIVGTPAREESLAKTLGRTHMLYTQYVNKMHNRSGHLWQNRFHSCAMDEAHRFNALAYVERNPVVAGMVESAWDYDWSSAAVHCGETVGDGMIDVVAWREIAGDLNWLEVLSVATEEETIQTMKRHTHTGRPLGSDSFLSKVEYFLGRRVRALPVGRPKKVKPKKKSPKKKQI
jgi:putative transposase